MDALEIERASLKAWPGIEEVESESCLLKWANGVTKRANALSVFGKVTAVDRVISMGEMYYAEKGAGPIFRIPSFTENEALDATLDERGYEIVDRSWVMAKEPREADEELGGVFEILSLDDWLTLYGRVRKMSGGEVEAQRGIAGKIGEGGFGIVASEKGRAVCLGLGVVKDGYSGAFNIYTVEGGRRRGFGSRLVRFLENEGTKRGAEKGHYLQVAAANSGAISMYEKLGYAQCYEYWYRVKGLE